MLCVNAAKYIVVHHLLYIVFVIRTSLRVWYSSEKKKRRNQKPKKREKRPKKETNIKQQVIEQTENMIVFCVKSDLSPTYY